MASICIYTRSERLNATSIYVGRIHLFIGVFVPRAMSDGATGVAEVDSESATVPCSEVPKADYAWTCADLLFVPVRANSADFKG